MSDATPFAVNHNDPVPPPHFVALWERIDAAGSDYANKFVALRRAEWAHVQKLRLIHKIPYHVWAEALELARYCHGPHYPSFRRYVMDELFAEFGPRFDFETRQYKEGSRCPPWADRKYSEQSHNPVRPRLPQ